MNMAQCRLSLVSCSNYESPFSLYISCKRTVQIWKFYTQCALFGSTWDIIFI